MKLKRELPPRVYSALLAQTLLIVIVNSAPSSSSSLSPSRSPSTSTSTSTPTPTLPKNDNSTIAPLSHFNLSLVSPIGAPSTTVRNAAKIKHPSSGRRQGRLSNLSQDSDDHRQPSDVIEDPDEQQRAIVPKEGVMQMRRAARNAQRKMELVTGRVDQIQSMIADDHKPYNYTDNNSDSYNDASGDKIVSSTPNGNLVVNNNIESPNQSQDQWSNQVGDEVDAQGSGGELQSLRLTNSSSKSDHVEWSTPMNQIKSVIPTRQVSNDQDTMQNRKDADDSSGNSASDQVDQQPSASENGDSFSKQGKRMDLEDDARSVNHEQFVPYPVSQGSINNTNDPASSSMLNVEYDPKQNYQYFNDLNAENHRQATRAAHESNRLMNSNNGAVAFRPSNPVGISSERHKAQNMTYINTDTDLMNSFSTQQQQSLPSLTSTTKAPTRKSAVHSYSSSNYGKSSKDQTRVSPATFLPSSMSSAGSDQNYDSHDYPSATTTNRFVQDQPQIQWPALAASFQNSKHQSVPITSNDVLQPRLDEKPPQSRPTKSSDESRQPMVSMMTQESDQTDIIQPKVSVFDNTENYQNNIDQSNGFNQQGNYGNSINRQLSLNDMDSSNTIYNANNNIPAPQMTNAVDETPQETTSEPERQRFYQTDMSSTDGTSNNNNRQQLRSFAAALVANNPSIDVNTLIQNYRQQQQQQQQIQLQARVLQQQPSTMMPIDRSSSYSNNYGPSISRSFYTTSNEPMFFQKDTHNVYKRYSPEMFASYMTRPTAGTQFQYPTMSDGSLLNPVMSDSVQLSANLGTDAIPYGHSSATQPYQPIYTANYDSNNNNNNKAFINAYYRTLQAAAAQRTSLDNSQLAGYQAGTVFAVNPAANYSSAGSGSLYATAAMNSPAFYEAPTSQQQKQQQQQQSLSDSYGISGVDPSVASSSASQQQYSSPSTMPVGGGGSYKRSYLNSIFKPAASSRFYYTPTILSPISLASPTTAMHSLYAPTIATAAAETIPSIYATNPYGALLTPAAQHDPAAQYHALAAAANSLQPHYMEPEMAESSLVASESQSSGSANQASGDSDGSASSSSKSGSKGMGPWTNIAGLLLGILPFGILMASLLPAVTVAGRKKRELELVGGRNFSELLSWRAPSKVLEALMGLQRSDGLGFANASAIINEQLAALSSGLKSSQLLTAPNNKERYGRRRSLLGGSSSGNHLSAVKANQTLTGSGMAMRDRSTPSSLMYNIIPDSVSNFTSAEALNQANSTLYGVKGKFKKAFSALNYFITTAQNIKRKHRSSIIDTQWNLPGMLKNILKLDNLFNVDELKRQLASVAYTRAVLAQQRQMLEANAGIAATPSMGSKAKPAQQEQPKKQQEIPQNKYPTTTKPIATSTTSTTTTQPPVNLFDNYEGQQGNYQVTQNEAFASNQLFKDLDTAGSSNEQKSSATTEAVSNDYLASSFTTERPDFVDEQNSSNTKNSTIRHLEICLNQFLCRLTVKLNKSMKNSLGGDKTSKLNKSPQASSDQLEKITKSYINQLVEQIEAQNPSVLLGLKESGTQSSSNSTNGLDQLYKNAMKNQCPLIYNCVELDQLEKTLSKMKLKFS